AEKSPVKLWPEINRSLDGKKKNTDPSHADSGGYKRTVLRRASDLEPSDRSNRIRPSEPPLEAYLIPATLFQKRKDHSKLSNPHPSIPYLAKEGTQALQHTSPPLQPHRQNHMRNHINLQSGTRAKPKPVAEKEEGSIRSLHYQTQLQPS
ncbi:predicted protein, partial [Arabidopsis lyrata subsp. lyrata]